MGRSTTGILGFGHNLGGPDSGYNFAEDLEDLPWYSEDEGLADSIEQHLFRNIANFTEKWADRQEGYWERRNEALNKIPVKVQYCGSTDFTSYLLVLKNHLYRADDWGAERVSPGIPRITELLKLDNAVRALGITLTNRNPSWILASYYG